MLFEFWLIIMITITNALHSKVGVTDTST